MPTKRQIKEQDKVLRNIFIIIGAFLIIFLLGILFISSVGSFKYKGVDFKIVKEGNLIFYNTAFPMMDSAGNHIADYNFYLRNDPRKLDKVPFEGQVGILENVVMNMTDEFNCDGDGIIAIANFVQVLDKFGAKVIKDPEAGCDIYGKYVFIQIRPGEETKIEQFENRCYNFYVNDCEILKATEKFLVEIFAKAKKG